MNKAIINNLYEFWTYIGKTTNKLTETENYKAVSMVDSDWPNRLFDVSDKDEILTDIIDMSLQYQLPNIITLAKPNPLASDHNARLKFGQKNMAINLNELDANFDKDEHIFQVKSKKDAIGFASTASVAFGYQVDGEVVDAICRDTAKVRLFNYKIDEANIGCGIVFFDSQNIAGLHMIGTVTSGRGKGIGNKMTLHLLSEAIANQCDFCVLHASMMGESIYTKLGFIPFGEVETYQIVNNIETA